MSTDEQASDGRAVLGTEECGEDCTSFLESRGTS